MLKEILCDKFIEDDQPRGKISFNMGLNVVLGTANIATNSIGKSTFLMVIDFVFGGNDYVEVLASDVQDKIGPHTINFTFEFDKEYYFARKTDAKETVYVCDKEYNQVSSMTLKQYTSFLQEMYSLGYDDLTFRNMISRFIRVYNRDTCNEQKPLQAVKKDKESDEVNCLLKMMHKYNQLKEPREKLSETEKNISGFKGSANIGIYSPITKKEFPKAKEQLEEINAEIEDLQEKSKQGTLGLEAIEEDHLIELKKEQRILKRKRGILYSELINIEKDEDKSSLTASSIRDLENFFPEANIRKFSEIENFHKSLRSILAKERKDYMAKLKAEISIVEDQLKDIEDSISQIHPDGSSLSLNVLNRHAALCARRTSLENDIKYYKQQEELDKEKEIYTQRIENIGKEILPEVEKLLNDKMGEINDSIYKGSHTSPTIKFNTLKSYTFTVKGDEGTGARYRGLIIFDMAMMALTNLPLVVHDSLLLKNIEDYAVDHIFEKYSQYENRQIFVSIDKTEAYSEKTQDTIEKHKVISLGEGSKALYGFVWNKN